MAIRKKSIKIPVNYNTVADLTSGATGSIGTTVIYVPENTSGATVNFASVNLFVALQDTSTATGASLGVTASASIAFTGGATTSVSFGGAAVANTGENWAGVVGPISFASYFNSNWGTTATSKSVGVQLFALITTGTGTTIRGTYAWFEITYTYDDTATTTRVQTIGIPYESQLSSLSTTANTLFATMPQLTGATGWLAGYSGVNIRHRWIEIKGNSNAQNTTDLTLTANFDSGTSVAFPIRENALASDTYNTYQLGATGLSTTATHLFQLWQPTASRWFNIVATEYVTFEYSTAGTTSVLNYVELPVTFDPPISGTTSAQNMRYSKDFFIQEPDTILLRKCGVELNYASDTNTTMNVKGGTQTVYRAYAMTTTLSCGQYSLQHCLDSTSGATQGITLVRGKNTIDVDLYRSVGQASCCTGVIKLLYSSGVASQGVDAHNHVCWGFTRGYTAGTTVADNVTDSFDIPETSYWINAAAMRYWMWNVTAGVGSTFPLALSSKMQFLTGEGKGAGYVETNADFIIGESELSYRTWTNRIYDYIKRHPRDPETYRVNIETPRIYQTSFSSVTRYGAGYLVSYHAIGSTVSGTISGSAGGPIDIDLFLLESDGYTHTMYDGLTQTGNGTFSFTTYNDTASYIVTAHESNTLKGVSILGTPGSDFSIDLAGGGGGGEFFF